jgi:hypothetical protein
VNRVGMADGRFSRNNSHRYLLKHACVSSLSIWSIHSVGYAGIIRKVEKNDARGLNMSTKTIRHKGRDRHKERVWVAEARTAASKIRVGARANGFYHKYEPGPHRKKGQASNLDKEQAAMQGEGPVANRRAWSLGLSCSSPLRACIIWVQETRI